DDLGDFFRRLAVERAVQRDDSAEPAHRITFDGAEIGIFERRTDGDAARIRMLDDGAGGTFAGIELSHQFERRVGVEVVDVAELAALHLLGGGDSEARFAADVERGLLVRIFAVAQRLAQRSGETAAPWRRAV